MRNATEFRTMPHMDRLTSIMCRLKLSPSRVAIIAGAVVAGLDLLAEFWRWLGQVPQ